MVWGRSLVSVDKRLAAMEAQVPGGAPSMCRPAPTTSVAAIGERGVHPPCCHTHSHPAASTHPLDLVWHQAALFR